MTSKESSDELHPAIVTPAALASSGKQRTPLDYLALGVATCGVGFIPLAPGTWGSLVGVGLFLGLRAACLRATGAMNTDTNLWPAIVQSAGLVLLLCGLTSAGIWAATRTESLLGRKDPGVVVIDEVVGQLVAYILVPFLVPPGGVVWPFIVVGFFAFRAFDIWKPYPIRKFEKLGGGLGIVADDWLAGNYAAALLPLFAVIYQLS